MGSKKEKYKRKIKYIVNDKLKELKLQGKIIDNNAIIKRLEELRSRKQDGKYKSL